MTEYQIDALIEFVRREAWFAEQRAQGRPPSPKDEKEAVQELREALRDTDSR